MDYLNYYYYYFFETDTEDVKLGQRALPPSIPLQWF